MQLEDVLLAHPAVREAGGDDLIAFCRERTAASKYPRSIEVLDELPKSATRKILRRELRA